MQAYYTIYEMICRIPTIPLYLIRFFRFKLLTLAMSKIWAAVSVQCQAFLMKNDFLDSE